MRYYAYDILIKDEAIPDEELTEEEQNLGYRPSRLERKINRIYNTKYEEVINMNITLNDDCYRIIYVTKSK